MLVFSITGSIVIIQAQSFSAETRVRAGIAGLASGVLAFLASVRVRMAAGMLAPAGAFAAVGLGLWSGLAPDPVGLPAILGSLLGVWSYRAIRLRWCAIVGTVALVVIIGAAFIRWHAPRAVVVTCIALLSASVTAATASGSAFLEQAVLGALNAMRGIMKAVVAFIGLYAVTAFAFALVYGVYYYVDGSALKYSGSSPPDILTFFQWSLTVLVTAGTAEFETKGPFVRLVYVVQLLANLFITGFFVSYFVTHAQALLKGGRR
jgi:hypothetical protein